MSKIAGDFTCGELLETQVKIDRIWADASARKDYQAEVNALTVLRANQTATLKEIEDPEKDRTLKIQWITDCTDADQGDCTDDCVIGGPELEADCKTYALNLCHKIGFTIEEKVFRTSEFSRAEVLAKALLKKSKTMDEWITQQVVAQLDAMSGVNQHDDTMPMAEVVGTETYIGAPYWTAELMAYFAQVSIINKMRNSFFLSGTNLFSATWLAKMNAMNADGKGADNMFSSQDFNFDLFNIDGVLGVRKSLLIERSAYAFATKAYYSDIPVEYNGAGITRFSIPSKNLPGVRYDVNYTTRCAANKMYHDYSLEWHGGFFQNPLPCNSEMTGVLSFVCGVAP